MSEIIDICDELKGEMLLVIEGSNEENLETEQEEINVVQEVGNSLKQA